VLNNRWWHWWHGEIVIIKQIVAVVPYWENHGSPPFWAANNGQTPHPDVPPFFSSIAEFCAGSDRLSHDIYKHPSQRLEADWRIPCANKAREQSGFCRPSASGMELFEAYTYIKNGDRDPSDGLNEFSFCVSAYRGLMGDQFKRRPFITTRGYVGLAPWHSEPGDIICILYGCVVPFVLRRNGAGYQLIREAYVHGIMDGEFVEKDHDSETFDLY
jgi:hypothetical protein